METRVSITFTRGVIQYAAGRSIDIATLCNVAGITPEMLSKPDETIEGHQSQKLWQRAEAMLDDPDLGLHIGELSHPSALGLVGFVMLSCDRLGSALDKLIRYTNLLTDGIRGRLYREGALARFEIEIMTDRVNFLLETPRQQLETSFSSIVALARALTGKALPVVEVAFAHARPAHSMEHERIFAAPILFSQSHNRLTFSAEALDLPVLHANHDLLPLLEARAEEGLRRQAEQESLSSRVQREIVNQLRGDAPNIGTVARALGLGERSLQRELAAEGTSFRDLLDTARCELALHHLRNPRVSVAEVAILLGFSEPSAFHRSFKRWTGRTPQVFRNAPSPDRA
ncbi:MAG: AraC family transcriptional regulator [Blastocatellia bacterium]|nr:AraC family transcriptional regulator [Blastocatellia bacterium]